jgi:AcrR family transcriptional regulator
MPGRTPTIKRNAGGLAKIDSKSRLSLILAAERHFALNGFAGVPLKAIHAAAGHRNASATQYHFGSREGLINAIINYRMPPLNQRRLARLATLKLAGQPPLHELVSIWIEPLADELRGRTGGNFYLRFLERLRREASSKAARRVAELQSGYVEFFAVIASRLAHLPPPVLQSRLAIAAEQIISALASLEAAMPTRKRPAPEFPSYAVNNLIDYVAGGLIAMPSSDTLREAHRHHSVDFQLHFLQQKIDSHSG